MAGVKKQCNRLTKEMQKPTQSMVVSLALKIKGERSQPNIAYG